MSAPRYPEVVSRRPSARPSFSNPLASPPPSPDFRYPPSQQKMLGKHRRSEKKQVRWSMDVIDNEYKRSVRPESPIPRNTLPPGDTASGGSHTRAPSNFHEAKTSAPDTPSKRSAIDNRLKKSLSQDGSASKEKYSSHQLITRPVIHGSPPIYVKHGFQDSRPRYESQVPPAAPEPPQSQGPPPTPRITRLRAPDLPEINHGRFCDCRSMACNSMHRKEDRPRYIKQMDEAKVHINAQKRR